MASVRFPPVTQRFLLDFYNEVSILTGPIGAGKSYTLAQKLYMGAQLIKPLRKVRRSRWLVFRSNYNELEQSILRDLEKVVDDPKAFKVRGQTPIEGELHFINPRGEEVHAEIVFDAYESAAVANRKLRSTHYTNALCLEMQTLNEPGILTETFERTSRFPASEEGGITWELGNGVVSRDGMMWGDMNYTSMRHWFYKYAVSGNKPLGDGAGTPRELYNIPPAMVAIEDDSGPYLYQGTHHRFDVNPEFQVYADLVHGKRDLKTGAVIAGSGFDYYWRQLRQFHANGDDVRIQHDLLAEWSAVTEGAAVHPRFSHKHHVFGGSGADMFDPTLTVHCGVDGGLNNSWVFGQYARGGRLNILSEVCCVPAGKRLDDAIIEDVLPHIAQHYGQTPIKFWMDPAAGNRASTGVSEIEVLRTHGLDVSEINVLNKDERAQALDRFLKLIGGFSISVECEWVVGALAGGMHYPLDKWGMQMPGWAKNDFSHPGEACQYLAYAMLEMVREGRGRTGGSRSEDGYGRAVNTFNYA